MKKLQDKFRGCLIGGAVGDALGYPVEFMNESEIFNKYGENGITKYELTDGKAIVSDDTQMTMFTANGLIYGITQQALGKSYDDISDYIYSAYRDWLATQSGEKDSLYKFWIMGVPQLYKRRAPGNTCISALMSGQKGNLDKPINDSKGCGGVMRIAPIGLFFKDSPNECAICAAECSAITHGHELGYIPSAMLSYLIYQLTYHDSTIEKSAFELPVLCDKIFGDSEHAQKLNNLVSKAIHLAKSNIDDLDAIHQLGEGWVAEETFAIALYCAIKYSDNFEKAVITAVNHNGDSDSTGAVTGNILGAYLGLKGIPDKFRKNLEMYDVITELADDLYKSSQNLGKNPAYDEEWTRKYINPVF
ncbi:MAG: ADP-ribosylglycohydrolase family protein [Ruminococcus flavefaciens]|nr:ADP-ribosylglycohydrolase family protein [Ruminococcus flavefaciens]MCM1229529.1 ADP-ribosylglycohydrolase family protein [Ruminococcus flavefaciens]